MLPMFPRSSQKRGEVYFREGRVLEIAPLAKGAYEITVQGSEDYVVRFYHLPKGKSWTNSCSCPIGAYCKHAYAALKALMAERSSIVVAPPFPVRKVQAAESKSPLAGLLSEKLGRALNRAENRFLDSLHQVYERCRARGYITPAELDQLGLPLQYSYWQSPQLWPKMPTSEHLFWLFLARAACERNQSIPDFMEPITDLAEVDRIMAAWKREQEIAAWRSRFGLCQFRSAPLTPGPRQCSDVRVALFSDHARLEWKLPGKDQFVPAKQNALREMARAGAGAVSHLPLEAQVIWQVFVARSYRHYTSVQLNYSDAEDVRSLVSLIAAPTLSSRIVNRNGQPAQRVPEPLRWTVLTAGEAENDYVLRLVQANGEPPPPLLFVARAEMTYYVTEDAVYTGPQPAEPLLDSTSPNRIPREALETPEGVALLSHLRVALPPRLEERTKIVPMRVTIRCTLDKSAGPETCLLRAQAVSEDGLLESRWTGHAWEKARDERKRKSPTRIIVYDESLTTETVTLLESLSARPHYRQSYAVALKVTKQFPEIFSDWLKTVPPSITLELDPELASLTQETLAGKLHLEVSETEIDWFDLRVVLDVSDTTLSRDEINLLMNGRGGYVRLKGKGWRRLKFDLTQEDEEQLARLGLTARELSAEPQRLHALQLAEPAAKRFLPEQQVEQIERRAGELKARVTPEIPTGVCATMRPYQQEGFHFLAYLAENRFGGILADDMGLGKTLQTLAWLIWLRQRANGDKTPGPSLVICPKSVMDNWRAEAARFTPALRVRVWSPDQLPEFVNQTAAADLHVINYAQLRILGESLAPVRWLAVILDEGQCIKNPSSQTAQVARSLHGQHRLILSGTPIENRLLDLWSLMAFAMPGVLGSRAQFARLYDAKGDPFARRRLAARVRPFLIRRTKSQVAKDLPDRIEEDLFCEIEGEQRQLYRAEIKLAQQMLLKIKTQSELARHQFHFLTSLLRLRQICCHPRLLKSDSPAPSAKVEALLEQLEPLMEEGHKVLVFSQFVQMLQLLKPALEERGWPLFYLTGETEDRGTLVEAFQSSQGPGVFLISLKAGGFGLNLTAASYVILFDPWWNPAVENQAIDRTHRIGQSNKVIAYRLLIKDSIEEKIRQLQKQKSALVEDVLGEEKFAQSLTLDDLRYLLAN